MIAHLVRRTRSRFLDLARDYPCVPVRRAVAAGGAGWVALLPSRLRSRLDLDGDVIDPLRVEIGGGEFPTPGYVHVDADRRARHVEYLAAAWELPFEDGSVHEIRAVHVLEHVPPSLVDSTLREWRRVLCPGGFAQVHVPNAASVFSAFLSSPPDRKWALMVPVFGLQRESAETGRNGSDLEHHQALYDFPLLEDVLLRAGFDGVEDVSEVVSDRHTEGWRDIGLVQRLSLVARASVASTASSSPREVEVSIVNHENRELLRACLDSIPDACAGLEWHATVIDNASSDGSLEMLADAYPQVGVLANRTRLGFGANHNQVIRRLIARRSAPYILVLNDDTELQPDAVSKMVRMLEHQSGLAAVVPTILDERGRAGPNRQCYPSARSALRHDRGRQHGENPSGDGTGWLQGCCLLLRLAALEQVGGFDERFFLFYEDTDLSCRLELAGWGLATCPDATVIHSGHASVFKPGLVDVTPKQGLRSRYLYHSKHLGPRRALAVALLGRGIMLARALKAGAKVILRRDQEARARARALLDLARFNPRKPLPQEMEALVSPLQFQHEPVTTT
jgi:GT2 family glycosyltransferase/SAM-dependent methyltransferase